MKHEWRKSEKDFYLPKAFTEIINIPKQNFIMIEGNGNPNEEDFKNRIEVLYSLAYAIKMMPKKHEAPKVYYEYSVYPLEGIWKYEEPLSTKNIDKNKLEYNLMIRQPDFVNSKVFDLAINIVKNKKSNILLDKVTLGFLNDGLSLQALHIGSYDDEILTFDKMKEFIENNNLEIREKFHREIYITDGRKKDKSKLKTVLRYMVQKAI